MYLQKPFRLQGMALGRNIQVRTRSVPGVAGVPQVSSVLPRHGSSMLNSMENLGM